MQTICSLPLFCNQIWCLPDERNLLKKKKRRKKKKNKCALQSQSSSERFNNFLFLKSRFPRQSFTKWLIKTVVNCLYIKQQRRSLLSIWCCCFRLKCLMDFSWSGCLFRREGISYFYVLRRYDYVEIHDGNSETADLLGKHCSNIAPAPIISSGPSLHIKFVSDYAHQGAGFSLRYEIFKTGKLSRYCYWYIWSKILGYGQILIASYSLYCSGALA